ncbi:MAG: hypothetical protein ACRDVP_10905 [Acidimicrobiales bacterium]
MRSGRLSRGAEVCVAVVGGLLAWWAAETSPFTTGADAVTTAGFVVVAAFGALAWTRRTSLAIPSPSTAALPAQGTWWPWLAAALLVLAWELICVFLTPRIDHPTVSSIYDTISRFASVKAALFFLWLLLGVALVRR